MHTASGVCRGRRTATPVFPQGTAPGCCPGSTVFSLSSTITEGMFSDTALYRAVSPSRGDGLFLLTHNKVNTMKQNRNTGDRPDRNEMAGA
ncbi:hypothetical protein, partial [Citrobacter sp. VF227]